MEDKVDNKVEVATKTRVLPETVYNLFMEQGLSYKAIGALLGVTSNTIAGICYRNGFRRPRFFNENDTPTSPPSPSSPLKDKIITLRPRPVAVKKKPPKGGVLFMNLKNHHCRYIVGENEGLATYCGTSKIHGSSYCNQHHELTHQRRI